MYPLYVTVPFGSLCTVDQGGSWKGNQNLNWTNSESYKRVKSVNIRQKKLVVGELHSVHEEESQSFQLNQLEFHDEMLIARSLFEYYSNRLV